MISIKAGISVSMEYLRPAGIIAAFVYAYDFSGDPLVRFHFIAPVLVLLMAGTVACEGLFLGSVGSEKIGYSPDRGYQIQSALNNLALAVTALMDLAFGWGFYADLALVTVLLLFFSFSAVNHLRTALSEGNRKAANLFRPIGMLALIGGVLPLLLAACRAS